MDVAPPRRPATWRTWTGWPRRIATALVLLLVIAPAGVLLVRSGFGTYACVASNDISALSSLRAIAGAQADVRDAAVLDRDRDGRGEYGSLRELAGAAASGEGGGVLEPPVLSGAFRTLTPHHTVSRSGYHFRVYLRDAAGAWVNADAPDAAIDPGTAGDAFVAVAWPVTYGRCGRWTFACDQDGTILRTDARRYTGAAGPVPAAVPRVGSALVAGRGADGGDWSVAAPPWR